MGTVGPYLVAGLTVLLVMSLAAVIVSSPENAVRSESPGAAPIEADEPSDTADPALNVEALVAMTNSIHPPRVSGGPPWAPAPKPPFGLPG
jgi:hypothetical protein